MPRSWFDVAARQPRPQIRAFLNLVNLQSGHELWLRVLIFLPDNFVYASRSPLGLTPDLVYVVVMLNT